MPWLGVAMLFVLGAPIFVVLLGFAMAGSAGERGLGIDYAGQLSKPATMILGEHGALFATIPLFIFAGYLLSSSRAGDRLIRFFQALLGWLPGGLGVATVFACAAFTVFTGASGVTIVALGGLLMPALVKQDYPEKFSLGLVTGTGSIGLLFFPAVPLVVYGVVYAISHFLQRIPGEFNSERFLFAGIVPGLVLCGVISAVVVVMAIKKGVPRHKFSPGELGLSTLSVLPELALLPLLFVAISLPTMGKSSLVGANILVPAAAFAVAYVFILEVVVRRELDFPKLRGAFTEAIVLSGAILIIIATSAVFTDYITQAKVPTLMVDWISDNIHSKFAFLIALNLLLIVVGMMMDIFSAIVIVVPLIAGVAVKVFGIDPYHLGIIFLVNLEIGYLTPPVGLNLFVAAFRFNKPVAYVMRAAFPFLLAMIVALALVTFIPSLVWLPPKKRDLPIRSLNSYVLAADNAQRHQGTSVDIGKQTLQFNDCLSLAKDGAAYIGCESLFDGVADCDSNACKNDTVFAYAAGLDCSMNIPLKDCEAARDWAELRESCMTAPDLFLDGGATVKNNCMTADSATLTALRTCLGAAKKELARAQCFLDSGLSSDGEVDGDGPDLTKCLELPTEQQDACMEKMSSKPDIDNDAGEPDLTKCLSLPEAEQAACIDGKAPAPGDENGDSANDDVDLTHCLDLPADQQDACLSGETPPPGS